jgi:hypothetical protein
MQHCFTMLIQHVPPADTTFVTRSGGYPGRDHHESQIRHNVFTAISRDCYPDLACWLRAPHLRTCPALNKMIGVVVEEEKPGHRK